MYLLEWLIGYDVASATTAVDQDQGQESGSCLVHNACPSLSLVCVEILK